MNHVVSFSGGRTSAYLVWLFEQKRKKENINVEYVFCDTGAEHPKTYKFIKDVVDHFKIKLTCLRVKIDFDESGVASPPSYKVVSLYDCKNDLKPFHDFIKKCSTPTPSAAECTNILKSVPSDKYCNEKYGRCNYIKWLGIRADEPKRIKLVDKQVDMFSEFLPKKKKKTIPLRYLGEISDMTKEDILDFWDDMPFDLEISEELGNCVFCIKKGANKIALAAKKEPKLAKDFINLVNLSDVRIKQSKIDNGLTNEQMYRDRMSLKNIIDAYSDFTIQDIESRLRRSKRFDTDSCSESCEAMTSPDEFELEVQDE